MQTTTQTVTREGRSRGRARRACDWCCGGHTCYLIAIDPRGRSERCSQEANHNSGLGEALRVHPITPDEENVMTSAHLVDQNELQWRELLRTKDRKRFLLGGSLTFFVILGGILATAIVVGATTSSSGMIKRQTDDTGNTINNNNDVSSSISLQEPTVLNRSSTNQTCIADGDVMLMIQMQLPQYTMEAILQDPTSPQSLAFHWIREDPHLSLYPKWRKIQRFALATLYYALDGDDWDIRSS